MMDCKGQAGSVVYVLWLVGLAMVVGSVVLFLNYMYIVEKDLGVIEDFEVSAGGFLSPSECKVVYVDGGKASYSGGYCVDLRSGEHHIVRENSVLMYVPLFLIGLCVLVMSLGMWIHVR